ncbi:hypothetical protein [Streptomyces sp. NPDC090022]|uniref:hypothetical protein n=1 Tax=Streptomyces sp. NPDC090022 TaxID=3365920 RepID=UPI0037FF42A9
MNPVRRREAETVLRDPRFGHGAQDIRETTSYGFPARVFVLTDPPGHTHQGDLVRAPFTPRNTDRLRRLARQATEATWVARSLQHLPVTLADGPPSHGGPWA